MASSKPIQYFHITFQDESEMIVAVYPYNYYKPIFIRDKTDWKWRKPVWPITSRRKEYLFAYGAKDFLSAPVHKTVNQVTIEELFEKFDLFVSVL